MANTKERADMADGSTVSSGDIYAANPIFTETSDQQIAAGGLVRSLRSRSDRGTAFWAAVAAALDEVPDREPVKDQVVRHSREGEEQVVYYIRFADRIKIGTTRDLAKRISAVPCDELLGTEPGGYELERKRHEQFRGCRVSPRGEWFTVSQSLMDHIASLQPA